MSTFKPLRLMPGMLVPELRQAVQRAERARMIRRSHPVSAAVFTEIPFGLFGSLAAGRSQVTFRTPYLDNDLVELAFAAPAEARQSALPSLEVVGRGRHGLATIPTDRGVLLDDGIVSRLPRRLFSEVTFKLDYLHKDGLPGWLMSTEPIFGILARVGLLGLHKYLPYRRWFRRELAPHVREVITDGNVIRMGLWEGPGLADMLQTHLDGRQNHVREVNAVLTLEAIDRLLLRGNPTPPHTQRC
jgi:asparagine synthase (glutamine-hydrolysing)